jgi:hypothetical protein
VAGGLLRKGSGPFLLEPSYMQRLQYVTAFMCGGLALNAL